MTAESVFTKLHPSLRQVLVQRLGWRQMREVQESVYRKASEDRGDILIMAPTAGGKSEAAFFPVIDFILKEQPELPACLYLSPLRALINDMSGRIGDILLPLHLETAVIHGDFSDADLIGSADPPAVIMTTPESLAVLMSGPAGDILAERLKFIIIDEVHAFVSSERGAGLMAELDLLDIKAGRNVRRFGISATVGNPEVVLTWLTSGRQKGHLVSVAKVPVEKEFLFIRDEDPYGSMLSLVSGKKSLIFVSGRAQAERAADILKPHIRHLFVHHSSLSSAIRSRTESAFASGESAIIISTSSLELGIDIGSLDMVIQVGSPSSVSSFLQRLGRSGRRGQPAKMVFVWKSPEDLAKICAAITAASQGTVEDLYAPYLPCQSLVQQIVLQVRKEGRISEWSLFQMVGVLSPFWNISEEIREEILTYLLLRNVLIRDSSFLLLGSEGEHLVQRGEIYSVISGRPSTRISTEEGDIIGDVDTTCMSSLQGSSFSLGGRSWVPTGTGSPVPVKPTLQADRHLFWTGEIAGTTLLLMQSMAGLLADNDDQSKIVFPGDVAEELSEYRKIFPPGIGQRRIVLRREGKDIVLYTFLGKIWNALLEAQIISGISATGRADDIRVVIRGKEISLEEIRNLMLRSDSERILMDNMVIRREKWKYADLLPEHVLREMWASDHLDISGFTRYLAGMKIIFA